MEIECNLEGHKEFYHEEHKEIIFPLCFFVLFLCALRGKKQTI
jgi:hypothetical protein